MINYTCILVLCLLNKILNLIPDLHVLAQKYVFILSVSCSSRGSSLPSKRIKDPVNLVLIQGTTFASLMMYVNNNMYYRDFTSK